MFFCTENPGFSIKEESIQVRGQKSFPIVGAHTVALALLHGVGVVEQALAVVGPGHAAELDPLQPVLQGHGTLHPQEADLHPVRAASTGAVGKVLAVL